VVEDVIQVGPITSTPGGRDSDVGSPLFPFRTLTQAERVAGPGDTIQLSDGLYDAAAGETWDVELPENVTISGASDMTVVRGPATARAPSASGRPSRAPLACKVRTLAVELFDIGVDLARPGTLTIENVGMTAMMTAIVRMDAPGSQLSLINSQLTGRRDGVVLGDRCARCAVNVVGGRLGAGNNGLYDGHTVKVSSAAAGTTLSFDHATIDGDLVVGVPDATVTIASSSLRQVVETSAINFAGGVLTVKDSTIDIAAKTFGINLQSGTLSLSNTAISGGNYGVYQLSGTSKVRDTTIGGYGFIGYYLAAGALDLGDETQPGNNHFHTDATGPAIFGLYVDAITTPVTCSNTSFNDVVPPAGTRTAGADPLAEPGAYFINRGKTISFWTL